MFKESRILGIALLVASIGLTVDTKRTSQPSLDAINPENGELTECRGSLPYSQIQNEWLRAYQKGAKYPAEELRFTVSSVPSKKDTIRDFNNASCNMPDIHSPEIAGNVINVCGRQLLIKDLVFELSVAGFSGPWNGRSAIQGYKNASCPANLTKAKA